MQVRLVLLFCFKVVFSSFAGFGNLKHHFKLGFVLVLIFANSRRFHQAGMKKCQVGNEEMEVELMQEAIQKAIQECRIFSMA